MTARRGRKPGPPLWAEAVGTASGQALIANRYGVSVRSSGGLPSLTFVHGAQKSCRANAERVRTRGPCLPQVGVWDASGLSLVNDTGEELRDFARDLGGLDVEVVRVAVTEAQIVALGFSDRNAVADGRSRRAISRSRRRWEDHL